MRRIADQHRRERIAVHVRVVGQDACGGDDQRRVLGDRVSVVVRHRHVVHRDDGNRDRGETRVELGVIGAIGERVEAGVVQARRVGERAARVERERAVRRGRYQHRRQRVAVEVAVVGQDARGGNVQRRVFIHGVGIIRCGRRAVLNGQCRAVGARAAANAAHHHAVSSRLIGREVAERERAVRADERVVEEPLVSQSRAGRDHAESRVAADKARLAGGRRDDDHVLVHRQRRAVRPGHAAHATDDDLVKARIADAHAVQGQRAVGLVRQRVRAEEPLITQPRAGRANDELRRRVLADGLVRRRRGDDDVLIHHELRAVCQRPARRAIHHHAICSAVELIDVAHRQRAVGHANQRAVVEIPLIRQGRAGGRDCERRGVARAVRAAVRRRDDDHRHWLHRDRDRRHGAGRATVARAISEAVAAAKIRVRLISERAVQIQRERAVRRITFDERLQRVVLHVRVVREHAGRGDSQRGVRRHGVGVVVRHRHVVHRRHADAHSRGVGIARTVRGAIRE